MKQNNKSFRKIVAATLSATMAAGAVVSVQPNSVGAEGVDSQLFTDVKITDYFYEAVQNLSLRDIITGYGDQSYRPNNAVTRAEAAKILALTLDLDTENVKNPGFKDVQPSEWYFGPVAALVDAGILEGYNDDTFKPNNPLTRAEMAKIITVGFDLEKKSLTNNPFTDVKADDWYADYIGSLISGKITTGKTANAYAPNDRVTRGQMAAFISRSEAAMTTVQSEIINITNTTVELAEGTYALTADMKTWLNPSNLSVLKGAVLNVQVKHSNITSIESLEITAHGQESNDQTKPHHNHLVLDGKGNTFAGNLIINGDYISLENLTIKGDLEIGKEVTSSFYTEDITVEGKTKIADGAKTVSKASNETTPFYKSLVYKISSTIFRTAAAEVPVIVFYNSNMGSIEVTKEGIIIEQKGTTTVQEISVSSNIIIKADGGVVIPKVTIKEGATQITIDASVNNLSIETAEDLTVNGTGSIKSVTIESGKEVTLETEGKIEKIESKSEESKISLGKNTKVGDLVVPEGSQAEDIIKNYDDIKGNVDNIDGEKNSNSGSGSGGGSSSGGSGGGSNSDDDTFNLTIMHTNDTHAKVETAPKRITAIKEIRAEKPEAVLVDAGDVFSGTLYFNEYQGQADLEFMNLADYDVMTFGNHEFDLGSSTEGHQALADFIEGAKFSFVSSNVNFSADENFTGLFSDLISSNPEEGKIYNGMVKNIDGEKVGFFGLTTAETKNLSSPGAVIFEDYIEEAEKAVATFQGMGVNKIVAVSHIGYDDNPAVDNDLTLAAQVDGIDVIVGGHSHTELKQPVVVNKDENGVAKEPTVIVQASSQGDYLGTVDVQFDRKGKVLAQAGELIKVADKGADPAAVEILNKYKPQVDLVASTEIGVTTETILENPRTNGDNTKPSVRKNETPLGNLITDGMLAKAKAINPNVIMALQNGGGIRSSIDAGPITNGEVINVLPFGNTLSLVEITGAELKEAFEISVGKYPLENGGFLHVSGAKVQYDSSKPSGERVVSISYKKEGTYTKIQDGGTYTITTNAFTAKGGDGYDVFAKAYGEGRVTDLGLSDWENFAEHLRSLETITPVVEGRIVNVAEPSSQPVENTSDLIISEYIEGSSYNKAIELYNGTGSAIDLSEYTLELYSNASTAVTGTKTASSTVTLSGTLASDETYVLYHSKANEDIKGKGDLPDDKVINFNGNDQVVLKKADMVIDAIGQVGTVENWGSDVTLVRSSAITTGDKTIDDAFDPSVDWTALPKDDSSNLGTHVIGESGPVDPPEEEEPAEVISMADARAASIGDTVTIKGVVAANLKNTVSVQDATGGIAVRPASLDAAIGDEVTLTGKLAEYKGLLQLDGATIVEKVENAGVPKAKVVTGAEVAEENESQLVTAKNMEIVSKVVGSSWTNYTVTDGTTQFIVRDENNTLNLAVGTTYDSITGIVQQFDTDYQIIPRSSADIIEDESVVQPVFASSGAGAIAKDTKVSLTSTTTDATIYYTTDGTEPTPSSNVYREPIVVDKDMTLKAIAVKEGLTTSRVTSYEYTVFDPEQGLQIHHIQGASHQTPKLDETVAGIEGIVTYVYKIGSGHYFHMQTPDDKKDQDPKTSEGIVVYTGNTLVNVEIGDLVSVAGKVDEYHIDGYYDTKQETDLPVTQINARNDQGGTVTVKASQQTLPEPIKITSSLLSEVIDNDGLSVFDPEEDMIDFWESIEGMRVEVGTVKAVAPQEHGDLITVLEDRETDTLHGGIRLTEENANADRIQFKLYDNNEARDFNVATGDRFTGPITGVVNYGFQNYKIYADYETMRSKHVVGNTEPETTTIVKEDDKLTIASYNLENFSNNSSETSADKAQKLARAFAVDMQSPDIIGVTEVQDNNGEDAGDSAANQSYERLIAEIEKAGGVKYKYVNIDPVNNADGGAPNANIQVGFLYNPERVTLTEGMLSGDAITAVGYKDGKLTHNPGRIDPTNDAFDNSRKPLAAQFDFQGESVVVIVNHWNSKSGDTPLFGSTQPPVYGSEAQRHEIANVVYDFVERIKTDNPDANIVSVGDFNDFQFTETLQIHEGELMTNMINVVEESDRYTYLYQGNSQVLDHILVSNNLVDSTEIDILHINADFTDMAGRASDHDPVLVQVGLSDETEVE